MFQKDSLKKLNGVVTLRLVDPKTKRVLFSQQKKNVITRDASLLVARLLKDNSEPNFGAYMLAVGSGATGSSSSPDAPDERQRKLNAEVDRKAFDSISFINPDTGLVVAYPTNIIDLSVTFLSSEAVGSLNEMGIISPISGDRLVVNPNPNTFPTYDNTLDITPYDVLLNYFTFGVITKPGTLEFEVIWRLTT